MDTNKFMTKWCLCDGEVFVDLSLLNILVDTIISIYNELGPVLQWKIFPKNLQKLTKLYENCKQLTIKSNNSLRGQLTILVLLTYL